MRSELFINGRWVSAESGDTMDVVDPSNLEIFHRVSCGGPRDIDKAVTAARQSFDGGSWSRLSGAKRAAALRKMAQYIGDHKDEIARIEVRDNGKPLPEAAWDVGDTVGCFEFYAGLAEKLDEYSHTVQIPMEGFSSRVLKEPIGVVGAIIPWNYPLLLAAWKVAPALAAGCSIVLKPSELTPISALELGAAAEFAGIPPGVLNIVNGLGSVAGEALTAHAGVDKLAFTGSNSVGRKIMQAAAKDVKAVSLELGGKSPLLIFADTPIDEAVEWIMNGAFWNKGEVCTSTSRVLIERSIFDDVLKRLIAETEKIKIGSGFDEGVLLGPLVSRQRQEKVLAAIRVGVRAGARLRSGGNVPKGLKRGCFVEPTIFTDVPLDSELWNEEIFGPVVCIRPFESEAEAVAEANRTKYGLAAAVLSRDIARAERVARAYRAGIVWINCSQPTFVQAPWGGYKQSGIGRELGEWGLDSFLEIKQVTTYDRSRPWGWYITP